MNRVWLSLLAKCISPASSQSFLHMLHFSLWLREDSLSSHCSHVARASNIHSAIMSRDELAMEAKNARVGSEIL